MPELGSGLSRRGTMGMAELVAPPVLLPYIFPNYTGSNVTIRPGAVCGMLLSLSCSTLATEPADTAASRSVEFLPGIPHSPRLTASPEEPRTGIRKTFGSSKLKLDIGAAYDFLEWHPWSDSETALRLGAEFFAYTLIMNAQGLRLQADAADGFFGGHLFYTIGTGSGLTAFRLRILHLSAHFLDGHVSEHGGRAPIAFSRDYGELTHLWRWGTGRGHVQLYDGAAYATLIRPENIRRWSFLAGGEYVDSRLARNLLGQPCHCYAAVHFSLMGIRAWTGTTHVEAGVRIGSWDRTGTRIYLSYQTGLDEFHQYYNVRDDSWGAGIAFDLW